MKRSLQVKLIFSYLAVALLTVLVVSVLIRLTSGKSLMTLVVEEQIANLTESLQEYYAQNSTLEGYSTYLESVEKQSVPQPPPADPRSPPPERSFRGILGVVDAQYRAAIPTFGYAVGEAIPPERIQHAIAVEVDGKTIAWILPDPRQEFKLSHEEELFLQRTTLAIGLAALAGVLAAVSMGFFLSRNLLRPIRNLITASQALARGQLEQQVPVTSQDELGLLTSTFNQMSMDLVHADQERKRLTADITHDLSTPLQIISGYIEMLEDSEVNLSPQRLEIIKSEIEHLRRLVSDLTILTQVEAGGLEITLHIISLPHLLRQVAQTYQPIATRQGIELLLEVPEDLPLIQVDEGRTIQVLKNLLDNALRYTPKGGKIFLKAQGKDTVEIFVIDTGEGIEAGDLPHVFERFYRADKARSGGSGKMGLGLAISKALVEAQGGRIRAESTGKGRGTAIIISFPPYRDKPAQE